MATNCTAGYGPDLLFRVPLEPFFPQSYGEDCYFSYVGYNVFGGCVLALVALVLTVHVATLLLVQAPTKLIDLVLWLQTIVLLSMGITIIIGFVAPRGFVIAWMIWMFFLVLLGISWFALGYISMVKTITRVEIKGVTLVSLWSWLL